MSASGPSATPGTIVVRHCGGLAEFEACMKIELAVWEDSDLHVPLPLYVVAEETGGQVLGAFAGERMIGFTMALAGVRAGRPILHSHMTAVLEEFRDRGVGRRLKLLQREDALARGIELVEWTFDPLEIKNAHFNLVRLGAIARRYIPNCYGITSSPLHAGLPTDRLMAEWWLESARVKEAVSLQPPAISKETAAGEVAQIAVPAEITRLRDEEPERAAKVQREIGEQFQKWFAKGYAAVGFELRPEGGRYILEP
ncbi:MAG TPA: hypothetical protein VI699_07495 [Candidatus Acidoferrales bacterium]|nr:hypothetical protein [Candidatus Acidoferrales bacterium]